MSRGRLLGALLTLSVATAAFAGGPLYTYDFANRVPYAWRPKVPIFTDLGRLGPLSNARAGELVSFGSSQWSGVSTSSFRSTVVGDFSGIGLGDVNGQTVTSVLGTWNGGGVHVVYDNDGSIFEDFFGFPAGAVLGITGIDFVAPNSPEILEAWMVLTGPGQHPDDPDGVGFQGVVTHEMGHAWNLGHSQVNGASEHPALQNPAEPQGCGAPWSGGSMPGPQHNETMYPFSNPSPSQNGEFMGTLHRDDRAAISDLYPAPGYPGTRGTIRGEVRDASGAPVTGVNVIARFVGNPFVEASSYLTGQLSKGQAGPDGTFTINDLLPGGTYIVYVDNLVYGAFSVPPVVVLPGPEEYFNGAMESGNGSTDNRCSWTTVQVAAGAPVTANITLNRVPGAPELIQPSPRQPGIPTDITPDGSVVVGPTDTSVPGQPGPAFRWDLNSGAYEYVGGAVTKARISDDGTKIAGNILDTDGTVKAAILENGSWTPLPPVPGAVPCGDLGVPFYTSVQDISGDGRTVVGLSYGAAGCYNATTRGFKWTQAGGTVALPKIDTLDQPGRANAVNFDGSVIVGWDQASTGLRRAVQWRNGTSSFIKIGTQSVGEALDVSRDGQYVVGAINSATSGEAWRYTPPTGVERLGLLPGQTGGVTNGISDDHEVITGYATGSNVIIGAAIWTSALRWTDLNQLFSSQGINTEGALPLAATAVSADGRTIAGQMYSQYGFTPWVLKIPTVLVCHQGQTQTVDFPQGMNTAVLQGATLGPCQCNTAAPAGTIALTIDKASPGTSRTSWSEVAGATGYDIVRGGLKTLSRHAGDYSIAVNACLENDVTSTSRDDDDTPTRGDGFWYLVGATTCGGRSTYDSGAPTQVGSRDAGIAASPYACP